MNLNIILIKYPQCLESRAKLSAILRDLYPSERREINIVLDIYECGIADKIKHLKSIDALQVQAFCHQLEVEYALPAQYALRGLALWLEAYNVAIQKNEVPAKDSRVLSGPTSFESNVSQDSENVYQIVNTAPEYELKVLTLATAEISQYHGHNSKNVIIPSTIDGKNIVGIGKGAFQHCTTIEYLRISEGIRYIEDGAFFDCSALKNCLLPQSLVRLGSELNTLPNPTGVFEHTALEHIILPEAIRYIGKCAFRNCSKLKSASILSSIECLPEEAFLGCERLTTIELSNTVKIISNRAFAFCESLQRIALPPNVKSLGEMTFLGCTSLNMIRLNVGLTSIRQGAFLSCTSLKEIHIPSTVTLFGEHLFEYVPIHKANGNAVIYRSRRQNLNLLIYCALGSHALEYAQRNNIEFRVERH